MANVFIVSDTHFGHANILTFRVGECNCPAKDGRRDDVWLGEHSPDCSSTPMRTFDSADQMDEFMVSEWNSVVKPKDKVYHIGDVALGKRNIATVGRCNGHKRLVRGNHDDYPTKCYLPFFEEIYATRVFEDMILSHIPLHPGSVREKWTNVHGHVHNNVPALHFGPKYLNVCVEVTNYRPLAIEEVRQRIRDQKAENQRLVNENLKRIGITPWDEGLEDLE